MKITILGTAYPLRGGIAHFNALLAKHLATRHEVDVITFKRQYPSILFPGKTQAESGEQPDLEPAPQLVDSINPFNWINVARHIRRRQPDLFVFKYWLPFFGPCFGTIARLVKRGTRTKILYVCDNVIPHERRPGDVVFTRYAFGAADYFIVQSDAVERDLLSLLPNARYRKVPHPVYEIFGTAIPKSEARAKLAITTPKVLLYFGYVRPYKGLMVLLDAMKHVRDLGFELSEMLLLVVGEFYDDEEKYRRRAKELGLDSVVRFVADYVPNVQVGLYFSAADAVVLPYLSATQSGITQIAYNFDKPVIATDVGGLAEVVIDGQTGLIVPPNDPEALAKAFDRFYSNKLEPQFTARVKEEKKKYSWENFIRTIEELVE